MASTERSTAVRTEGSGYPSRRVAGGLALLVYSAMLLAPNAFAWAVGIDESAVYGWQKLSYAAGVWICILALVGNAWWACLLVSPLLVLVPAESYLLIRYQSPLLPHVLGIFRETNLSESMDYMHGLWGLALIAYGGLALAAYLTLRVLRHADMRWRHRSRFWVLLPVVCTWGVSHGYYEYQEAGYKLGAAPDELRIPPPPFLIERLRETSPFGIPLRVQAYFDSESLLAQARNRREAWRFGAIQTPEVRVPQTFVLVLGESGRADRWQVNGYARQTSPRLSATPNLVSFGDMVSVATSTRQAVPAILTRRTAEMVASGQPFPERSVVSAFKEAGFMTYWYSTQAPIGYLDSPVSLHAREADVLRFLNVSGYMYRSQFDGVLLPELERALAEPAAKQLIVLHTLGSHFNYSYRYPAEFGVFRPAMGDATSGSLHDPAARELLSNAYDNSILYTDYFLAGVIDRLERSGRPVTAMLYIADHGENLFDEGCSVAGHLLATRQNFHVPGFFWYSTGYSNMFPDKVAHLLEHKDMRLASGNVFPTMLDAAGIRFPGEDLSRSIVSAQLSEKERLVVGPNGIIDYDRAHTDADCRLVN